MNVDLGIWDKLSKAIVLLLILAALLGIVLWYLPLISQNEHLRRRIAAAEATLAQETAKTRELRANLESLKSPEVIERLARERLTYARPGEKVIRFESPAAK